MSHALFSLTGRLNREPFWLIRLATFLIILAFARPAFNIFTAPVLRNERLAGANLLVAAVLILLCATILWIDIAIGAKRLHDRNKSAWWLLLFWLLPYILIFAGPWLGLLVVLIGYGISIWGLVEIGFLPGTVGPNQYGPDPLATV